MSSHEYDVIVVGAGNAGLVASLAAAEEGASVLVCEAASLEERGGNSRYAGGAFRVCHEGADDLLRWLGSPGVAVEVDAYRSDQFAGDMLAASNGKVDRDLLETVVGQSRDVVQWMADKGVAFEFTLGKLHVVDPSLEAHRLPSGAAVRAAGEGEGLIEDLFTAATNDSRIDIWYDAELVGLLEEGNGVGGASVVVRGTEERQIRGQVVVATGGFEANPAMRGHNLGAMWEDVRVRGTRHNTGRGLEAMLAVGAVRSGDWSACHASPVDADATGFVSLAVGDSTSRYSYPYGVLVNSHGDRFIDEGENQVWLTYAKTGRAILEQPGGVAHQVFDARGTELLEPRYATATPAVADSIEDLASAIDVDPNRLVATIDRFNQSTRPGNFDPYTLDGLSTHGLGLPKSNWALPIMQAPFSAFRVACGITFTFGGVSVSSEGRVLDEHGTPIPGLHAAGEVVGGLFYDNYPGAAGLTAGAVLGRASGRSAARVASGRESAGP